MQKLINLIYTPTENWTDDNKLALEELFGSGGGRYPSRAKETIKLRAPKMNTEEGVSYAAYIHPSNPDVGPYGGMCFVIFPVENAPCLVAMGIGTQGLSPDESILSRPGHKRKIAAITDWMNKKVQGNGLIAWTKQDPTRIDLDIPDKIKLSFSKYQSVFKRYGKVLYSIFTPTDDIEATRLIVTAYLDLMFEERGYETLENFKSESQKIRNEYFNSILPQYQDSEIEKILDNRRYVIIEGPPGTGKTRLALQILKDKFKKNGNSIQFHPNTTYENFVGGLSPVDTKGELGFSFKPKRGYLMDAIVQANSHPQNPYLLHVDEINRADLAKVLGESIFLFEANEEIPREVDLAYDFSEPIGNKLKLPKNLFILGTMNSSDRSIAILDIAIRRRFAFIKIWPQSEVVTKNSCELMQQAFSELLSIFIEYANDDAINLMPGHAYFLEKDQARAITSLQTNLYPLLEEYLAQGYVAGFSEHILAFMQWLKSL